MGVFIRFDEVDEINHDRSCAAKPVLQICSTLAVATGSWDLGQISSTMESTQSSARRPSRLTYKEASGMAATLSMLEDIGALHAALKISAENDKDQLL